MRIALFVEQEGQRDTGRCPCCGHETCVVWGFVDDGHAPVAAYFVQWTVGRMAQHGANFDLILGPWGEGTQPEDRSLVALAYRLTPQGPGFMVIDAEPRRRLNPGLRAQPLSRNQIIDTPTARLAFSIVDAITLQDERITEFFG